MRAALLVPAFTVVCACGSGPASHAETPATRPGAPPPGRCFLLDEMGVGEVRRSPADACATRISPASTFKIPHALAALDSGVLTGPSVKFAYDGPPDVPETWKGEQTLATATRYSVVWYFQRIATLLGADRERQYLSKLDYGNRDSSSGLTTFWLGESLRISPSEQERFLVRLYDDALPVTEDAMQTVRTILVQPRGVVVNALGEHPFVAPWPEGTVVSAKTGRADDVTWLVGHVERRHRAWVFVSCVIGPSERDPMAAINLAGASLREAGVL